MRSLFIICLVALSCVQQGMAGEPPRAEIMHFWVSPSEQAALRVLKQRLTAAGGQWIETALPNLNSLRSEVIDRIAEGLPPTIMQWHAGSNITELAELDLVADLEPIAQRQNWRSLLPQVVLDSVTYQDRFVVVPVNAHGENWAWYNRTIYRKLNLDYPRSWTEFLGQAPIIQKAGFLPLAISASSWEIRLLFTDILLAAGGRTAYEHLIYDDQATERDLSVLRQTLTILGDLRHYKPTSPSPQTWDEATRLVIDDLAAVQFMGDWAKGEFLKAGKRLGQDFDCRLAPGSGPIYVIVIDAFAFAKTNDPSQQKAQQLIAEEILSPAIQTAFNLAKGSVPVTTNVNPELFDECAQIALKAIREGKHLVPAPSLLSTKLQSGLLDAQLLEFWNDATLSVEQVMTRLAAERQ